MVKNLSGNAGNAGDVGLISGSGKIPWSRKWQPTLVFLPGKFPWTEERGPWWTAVHGVTKSL